MGGAYNQGTVFEVAPNGTIAVSDKPGRGYEIRKDLIEKLTVRRDEVK